MRFRAVCLVVCAASACGDNNETGTPDVPVEPLCAPTPGPLPTMGHFIDPLAVELAGCVEGGLADLPGRWFLRNPDSIFDFFYPKFEGSCSTGFTRSFFPDDDTDESDGFSQFTWTDGTRWYQRRTFLFNNGGEVFESTAARVLCMGANNTLVGTTLRFDNDRGETSSPLVGSTFGLKDGPSNGLTEVGAINTIAADQPIIGYNVVVEGDFAYVVGPSGLTIVDVSAPATPVVVGQVDPDDSNEGNQGYNDVRVVKTATKTVAFASPLNFANTDVIDVTDPANPVMLSQLGEYSHSVQVVTTGNTTALYLATYTDAVPKYDVTNPLVPLRLGAAVIDGGPVTGVHDLTVEGTHIYANYTETGLVALDVSAGLDNAVEEGRLDTSYSHASWVATLTSGKKVLLHGDEGLAESAEDGAAFLRILDGDPASPTYLEELSRYRSRKEVGIHNIQVVGDKVYLSYYQDGLRIVDIADPTQPTEVAHFNTWNPDTAFGAAFEGAVGVRVANGHVFVADIDRGLIILDEN